MGIEVRYSGSLADVSCAPKLEQDLIAMCREMGWRYCVLRDAIAKGPVPVDVRGLTFGLHPRCDLLHFPITREGRFVDLRLYGPTYARIAVRSLSEEQRALGMTALRAFNDAQRLQIAAATADALECDRCVGEIVVKTDRAGSETHVAVCRVLEYVKRRYAPNLEVRDDTKYFVHKDRKRLDAAMAHIDAILRHVHHAVHRLSEAAKKSETDVSTVDDVVRKLARYIADSHALH
jgi:hypothetical protein